MMSNESRVTLFRAAVYCLDVLSDYFVGIWLLNHSIFSGGQNATENAETATTTTAASAITTTGTDVNATLGGYNTTGMDYNSAGTDHNTTGTKQLEQNFLDSHPIWGTLTISFNHITGLFGLYFMLKSRRDRQSATATSLVKTMWTVLKCMTRFIFWPLLIPLYM